MTNLGKSDLPLNSRYGEFKGADEKQLGVIVTLAPSAQNDGGTEESNGFTAKFTSLIARGVKAGFNDFIRLMTVSKINVLMIFIPAVLVTPSCWPTSSQALDRQRGFRASSS